MDYYIHREGQQTGPFTEADLRQQMETGVLSPNDLAWHDGLTEWLPLKDVLPAEKPQATPPSPPKQKGKPQIPCKTCGQGVLKKKRKYRMSTPVVLIGYIFLIPSVLGIIAGILMLCASGGAATTAQEQIKTEAKTKLEAAAIPADIINDTIASRPVDNSRMAPLTTQQREAINEEKLAMGAGSLGAGAGAAITGGVSVFLIIASFVGGLLGWLLVMKKKVLQCSNCGSIIDRA